jgi:hypothetical protein
MMKESQVRLGAAGLVLVLQAGCMGASQARFEEPAPASRMETQTGSRSDVVDVDELQAVQGAGTAFDALRKLRPEFLTRRAPSMPTDPDAGYPVVYLDGQRLGGLNTLQGIPLSSIVEIRYLRSAAASERLGRNHPGGVIAVSTHQ